MTSWQEFMERGRRAGCFVPSGQFSDLGETIFEPWRRADSTAGMTIANPHGQEPWVLDVVAVSEPDADGMVVLVSRQGSVRVAGDYPCAPYTPEDAALEDALLSAEREALGAGGDRE